MVRIEISDVAGQEEFPAAHLTPLLAISVAVSVAIDPHGLISAITEGRLRDARLPALDDERRPQTAGNQLAEARLAPEI